MYRHEVGTIPATVEARNMNLRSQIYHIIILRSIRGVVNLVLTCGASHRAARLLTTSVHAHAVDEGFLAVIAGHSPRSTFVCDPCAGLTAVAAEVAACALYADPCGATRCVQVSWVGGAACTSIEAVAATYIVAALVPVSARCVNMGSHSHRPGARTRTTSYWYITGSTVTVAPTCTCIRYTSVRIPVSLCIFKQNTHNVPQ